MELKWLEDFLSLAETRNFSRSAELRFTTQPAFSRRIKALEDWVGAILIDRSAQPVALTEAGASFRDLAGEIVRQLYQGREEIHSASVHVASAIKVAATHSLSLTFFPRWIRAVEHMLHQSPRHMHLEKVFVSRLAAVLKSMVLDGRGLAWLPESHVALELAAGQLIRAGGAEWDLEVEITIFRPRDQLSAAAE